MSNYKGFDLFDSINDVALRTRNQAVVLANIAADHSKNKKITPAASGIILGYFNQIVPEDRKSVEVQFTQAMKERGYLAG